MIQQKKGELDTFDESLEFNTETFYNYTANFDKGIISNGINNLNSDFVSKKSSIVINDNSDNTLLKITDKGDIETKSNISKYILNDNGLFIETFKLDSCGNLILKNKDNDSTVQIDYNNGLISTKGEITLNTPMIGLNNSGSNVNIEVKDYNSLNTDKPNQRIILNNLLSSIHNIQNYNCLIPIVNANNQFLFNIDCKEIILSTIEKTYKIRFV